MESVILWTIQTEEAWKQLEETGYITGAAKHIEQCWLSSYRWMVEQMKERVGNQPSQCVFPIWAWYQWRDSKRKKPDIRVAGHLPRKAKGVRIEFQCCEDAALLSDFELWHYVLNYWYLPESIADLESFEAELARKGLSYFRTKPLSHRKLHEKIVNSWTRIFDLDWTEPDFASSRERKSIQATIWQLKMDQVRSVTRFTSR